MVTITIAIKDGNSSKNSKTYHESMFYTTVLLNNDGWSGYAILSSPVSLTHLFHTE